MSLSRSLQNVFVPPGASTQKARAASGTMALVGVLQVGLLVIYLLIRGEFTTLELSAAIVGCCYPFVLGMALRLGLRVEWVQRLSSVTALSSTFVLCLATGGIASPWVWLFLLMATSSFSFGGVKGILVLCASIAIAVAVLVVGSSQAWWPASPIDSAQLPWLHGVIVLHCMIVLTLGSLNAASARHARIRALQKARDSAESASQAKSRFLAMMSHELRTPMIGVLGTVDLLDATSLDGGQRDHLDVLRGSADGLLGILNDLLDYSRMQSGKTSVQLAPLSPKFLMAQVADLFRGAAEAKGVVVQVRCETERGVMGDERRLRQVLLNLTGNAVKFTDSGEISLTWKATEPGRWRIEVRDTGIGIASQDLERLFEPFVQVDDSRSRSFEGAGLGLAISKGFVDAMGGKLSAESKVGEGSCFYFELELESCDPPVPREEPGTRFRHAARSLDVLLAEDNHVSAKIIEMMVRKMGHRVTVVGNGRDAIAAVARGTAFDMVLMDMRMPILDGRQATAKIRELDGRGGRLPIYALTADALPEEREEGLQAGLTGYLTKPVDLEVLARVFDDVAANAKRTSERP